MTTYRTLKSNDVTDELWAAWSGIQHSDVEYDSPFLSPEFTRTVGTVRSDVEVTVIENAGQPVGFFPFQRNGKTVQPVSGRLSECHGAIVRPDADWSAKDLLKSAGIGAWHFDHLPESQAEFGKYSWGSRPSPYLDISRGYPAYRAELRELGSSHTQAERKTRKLERELGPLRFEWHSTDASDFETLVKWKSAQHKRTGVLQIFKHDWLLEMLKALMKVDCPAFAAPLGTLHAGDQLLSAHLSIRSSDVLHVWFPTYNRDFEKHSPGLILFLKLAEAAAERGIKRIDLGPGEERYKQNFKSGDRIVHEGMVSRDPIHSAARGIWFHTKQSIRQSRFRAQLEVPLTATRRFRQWLAFQ